MANRSLAQERPLKWFDGTERLFARETQRVAAPLKTAPNRPRIVTGPKSGNLRLRDPVHSTEVMVEISAGVPAPTPTLVRWRKQLGRHALSRKRCPPERMISSRRIVAFLPTENQCPCRPPPA